MGNYVCRRELHLVKAACQGHVDCVLRLLQAGTDPNPDKYPAPLGLAAAKGHTRCLQALIEAGAKVNRPCPGGHTPLMAAACAPTGSVECMKELIAAGAEVDARNQESDFITALMCAVWAENAEGVRLLIEAGADINARYQRKHYSCFTGQTALDLAVDENNGLECVRILLEAGPDLTIEDMCFGRTPLMTAAYWGDTVCAKLLLEAGADVNSVSSQPWQGVHSALTWSIEGVNNASTTLALLAAGADPNLAGEGRLGNNTMKLAAYYWHYWPPHSFQEIAIINAEAVMAAGADLHCLGRENLAFLKKQANAHDAPSVLELLDDSTSLNLKRMCRAAMRDHLTKKNPGTNLFLTVPRLPLPPLLQSYLLCGVSLEREDLSEVRWAENIPGNDLESFHGYREI